MFEHLGTGVSPRSYAITKLSHAFLSCAMGAAEDAAVRLYPVADHPAATWRRSLVPRRGWRSKLSKMCVAPPAFTSNALS